MANESQAKSEGRRGLFTGFEHFTTPTDADYRAVISDGLVILDTNALLNLYRYSVRPRKALLDILAKIGDHLWEPQQVMVEFWRNREKALQDYASASSGFEKQATGARDQTIKAINECAKRFGIDVQQRKVLINAIEAAYEKLSVSVKSLVASDGTMKVGRDTGTDSVLSALEVILRGRVGSPYDTDRYNAEMAEARRRIEAQIPPAFRDSSKEPGRAEGDYLVWSQILDEATERRSDVLFVTGDVKEDWWRDAGSSKQVGPRMELLQEFRDRSDARFFMLQPADFLDKAGSILQVSIAAESVEQAREVDFEQHNWPRGVPSESFEALIAETLTSPIFIDSFKIKAASADSIFDYIIRRSNSKNMAVVILDIGAGSSMARVAGEIANAQDYAAVNANCDSLLFIANRDVSRHFLSRNTVERVHFFVWHGASDDSRLYRAINNLVSDRAQVVPDGPLLL